MFAWRRLSASDEQIACSAVVDWSLLHAVNYGVAARDWLEDPVTFFASAAVPLYALATVGLWFLARPYGHPKWKLACVSALTSAGVALLINQAVSHLWDRPRPFVTHQATHLLASPSPDPSFPSDHAAAAFAIAFAVYAFSRVGGAMFLGVAALIGLSRIALGLHYPSDVLAGLLVGWVAASIVVRFGGPSVLRATTLLSHVSDPLLAPVFRRVRRLASDSPRHSKK
jgi:undecaprenyl-diphosphatase